MREREINAAKAASRENEEEKERKEKHIHLRRNGDEEGNGGKCTKTSAVDSRSVVAAAATMPCRPCGPHTHAQEIVMPRSRPFVDVIASVAR